MGKGKCIGGSAGEEVWGGGRAEGRSAGGNNCGEEERPKEKVWKRKCWRGSVREEMWGRGSAEGGSAGEEEERPK